jgi:enoyl-[acyl-carrier protein] reductase III
MTNKQPWALILGASSGFGEATALELARAGMNIFGVHLDRRDQPGRVDGLQEKIRQVGRECHFVNDNATLDDTRKECVAELARRVADSAGTLRVIFHSLAFAAFKPLVGAEEVINRPQLELAEDVMGNSLIYWVQECLWAGLLDRGARIFAMTSAGGSRVWPQYGPVGAAKACSKRTSGSWRSSSRPPASPPTPSWPASPIPTRCGRFRAMKRSWKPPASAIPAAA